MGHVRPVVGVVSAVVLFAGALGGAMPAAAQQATPSAGIQQIAGKVLSVDAKAKLLKIEAEKPAGTAATTQPMEFVFADTTDIVAGNRTLKPEELKTGIAVQVEYKTEQGKHIAQSVSVQAAGGAAVPAASDEGTKAPQQVR